MQLLPGTEPEAPEDGENQGDFAGSLSCHPLDEVQGGSTHKAALVFCFANFHLANVGD